MSTIECPHCGGTVEVPRKRMGRPFRERWDVIFSEAGKTIQEAADEAGLTYAAAQIAGKRRGYAFVRSKGSGGRPNVDRRAYVARRVAEGANYTVIASEIGITRERVRQIANRIGTAAQSSLSARRERAAARNAAKAEYRARKAAERQALEAALREKVEAGMSIRQAGMELGIGRGTEQTIARKIGLGAVTKYGRWRHRYRDAAE